MFTQILFITLAAFCLLPIVPSWLALLGGIIFALTLGNPFEKVTKKLSSKFLALSIVGLGAGINFYDIVHLGGKGFIITGVSIAFALALGFILFRLIRIDVNTSSLITFGTAICGGSAIAAAAPVLKSKNEQISIALGVVFTLNALALLLFPFIGEWFDLTQKQFGLWAAIAIHDTSSVVGASMQYGEEALEVATTVKLARALWIIPLVFLLAIYVARESSADREAKAKIKVPWFILGFIVMSALVTFIPLLQEIGVFVADGAKRLLVLTLFLIGAALSKDTLKQVGIKPFVYGVALWLIIASMSLGLILL